MTATGATGSPIDVTVTQQGSSSVQPILSVAPSNRDVSSSNGSTSFSVSNTGGGIMGWTASVTSGGSWLSIASGSSGTNAGTVNAYYTQNTTASQRIGAIRVTAIGVTGSPMDVTVGNKAMRVAMG